MRPKLKSDVLYVPTADGVHVFGAGADVALGGRTAYQWLDRLAPHLDGSTELDDLVRNLPDDKRAAVDALVRRLHAAGCVRDAAEDRPHGLTERELATYAAEIAFVEYHRDSAARRFESYRNSAVVVVGAGPAFTALVCSALHSGVRRLRAVRTAETATNTDRLAELAAEAACRDPEQTLVQVPLSDEEEAGLAHADLVLHVASSEPGVDRALRLDRLCRDSDTPLVQGLVLDDVAWLGPVGPAWESAWLRLGHVLGAPGPAGPGEFLTGPAAAVVAGHLGLAAFQLLTGVTPADGTDLTRIDLETLRTSVHGFLPHPATRPARPETEQEFTDRIDRLGTAEPVTEQDFSARAARCFDPHVGLMRKLDEQDFTQLPLHVTEAVTRTARGGRVFGAGTSFAEARHRAALRGLAVYAAGAPDPRRFGPGSTVWGWDLATRRARAVPAAEAFGTGAGLAARLGWHDAVTDGIGQQLARLAVADVRARRSHPVALDLAGAALTGRAARLLGLLRSARGSVRVADIGGALGVPVLAWWQDGRPVAVTCGPDAVAEGLERAVLDRQAVLADQPDYAPAPVTGLHGVPDPASGARRPGEPGRQQMMRALRLRRLCPVVVPLDHDPAVHEVLPGVLRVVLADG
ncbi:YcaO-like family protein [Streptomyces sp. A 4/2]|uniref:YcaO-like family protein n=1 Tax=Streptomyces sp. A 4/2 TaxID=2934314 RepID=UPI002023F254|nr:YcaO-like family protein [Streptomyces sp. A 4/2]